MLSSTRERRPPCASSYFGPNDSIDFTAPIVAVTLSCPDMPTRLFGHWLLTKYIHYGAILNPQAAALAKMLGIVCWACSE